MRHTRIERQTGHSGHIPVHAQRGLSLGHADGIAVDLRGIGCLLDLGLGQRQTAQNAQPLGGFAKDGEFHALVALLAVLAIHLIDDIAARHIGGVQRRCRTHGAALPFDAQLFLLGLVGREHLTGVEHGQAIGRGRCHGALGQRLDVVGVDRHIVGDLEHRAQCRRGGGLLVTVSLQAAVVVVAGLVYALTAQPQCHLQAIVIHRQRVAQGQAVEAGLTHLIGVGHGAAKECVLRHHAGIRVVEVVAQPRSHGPGTAFRR